jgi:hypothetical protein
LTKLSRTSSDLVSVEYPVLPAQRSALSSNTIAQLRDTFLLGAMSAAKDRVVFFDSVADNVRATIWARWRKSRDCTFEAVERVTGAIHGYLNVRFWTKADIPCCAAHVPFRG